MEEYTSLITVTVHGCSPFKSRFPLCDSDPQPRPQGFSLQKWVGREKALALDRLVTCALLHPKILGVIN